MHGGGGHAGGHGGHVGGHHGGGHHGHHHQGVGGAFVPSTSGSAQQSNGRGALLVLAVLVLIFLVLTLVH